MMMNFHYSLGLPVFLLSCFTIFAAEVAPHEDAHPNVVLILVDDMSWTGTSVQVDPAIEASESDFYQTPHIEAFAKQGMCFSAAYSPGPMCTPSRAGILTGKTPAALHMTTPGSGGKADAAQKLISPRVVSALPDSATTIAEVLKSKGYVTAHLGKWHLGKGDPGQHGFDVHDGPSQNESAGSEENPKDVFGLTERAVAFMEAQSAAGKPFYLQLSHYAVHTPVEALALSKRKFNDLKPGQRHDDVDYAAMTWDLDQSIGVLLQTLDGLNLSDVTYVILMSDNGGPGNRKRSQNLPLAGGKASLYEGGIRVPLFIRGPGIEAGSYCHENVMGCDLLPTISDWAQAELPDGIEGCSLVPLFNEKGVILNRKHDALFFHYPHYGMGPMKKPQSAMIQGDYKLLTDLESGESKLFDLTADISEQHDLSASFPDKKGELERLLAEWLDESGAQMPSDNPGYDPAATKKNSRARR